VWRERGIKLDAPRPEVAVLVVDRVNQVDLEGLNLL
jgi:hypothetical protein